MTGLDILLIVLALGIFYNISKGMDAHEAWLNRQPLREEARKNFQQAYQLSSVGLDLYVWGEIDNAA